MILTFMRRLDKVSNNNLSIAPYRKEKIRSFFADDVSKLIYTLLLILIAILTSPLLL
jgi:hypothetical protein